MNCLLVHLEVIVTVEDLIALVTVMTGPHM